MPVPAPSKFRFWRARHTITSRGDSRHAQPLARSLSTNRALTGGHLLANRAILGSRTSSGDHGPAEPITSHSCMCCAPQTGACTEHPLLGMEFESLPSLALSRPRLLPLPLLCQLPVYVHLLWTEAPRITTPQQRAPCSHHGSALVRNKQATAHSYRRTFRSVDWWRPRGNKVAIKEHVAAASFFAIRSFSTGPKAPPLRPNCTK